MRPIAHGLRAVTGRDPEESGRAATTLELLYDLTFVVAIGVAASQFAHMLASGDVLLASGGFAFTMFAICLTWINFTWYGSAFDTDDWFHRVLTLTQMVGVAVLAVGIGPMFASLHDGGHSVAGTGEVHGHVDMIAIVVGYVIMRLGYVLLWVRVAWHAPEHRPVAVRYIVLVVLAQVLWVVAALAPTDLVWSFVCIGVLGLFEVSIPALAQGRADGTPWHPHHIAERYGLLTIIALGEIVVGTVDSASAIVDAHEGHWNVPAAAVLVVGLAVVFGLWWTYFAVPFGHILHARPSRGFVFGYGMVPLLLATAAAGAGVHVVGLYLEHHSELSTAVTVLAIAFAVALFLVALDGVRGGLEGFYRPARAVVLAMALGLLTLSVVLAAIGAGILVSLVPVVVAVAVPVLAHEFTDGGE